MLAPFAALYIVNQIKKAYRKKKAQSRYIDYITATHYVGRLIDAAVIDRPHLSLLHAKEILSKFEKMHPEGKQNDGYDGKLLQAWVRFNIAYLLIHRRGDLQQLPK